MKTIKSWLASAAVAACTLIPTFASAQVSLEPTQGGLVKLNKANFWNIQQAGELKLSNVEKIADGLNTPTISPDGSKIILAQRSSDGIEPGKLYQWRNDEKKLNVVLEDKEVSDYVTWTSDDRFFMRERSTPFTREGKKLNFNLVNKAALFKDKRLINENPVVVFDDDDVIVMKRNNIIQAISDVTIDRYFAPQVSAKEDYIVFSGLTTGVNLFHIDQNSVVYQDKKGSDPRFSADGKYLVYAETSDDGHVYLHGDIIVVDLSTKTKYRVENPKKEIRLRASISKDAKFVAFENLNGETFKASLSK